MRIESSLQSISDVRGAESKFSSLLTATCTLVAASGTPLSLGGKHSHVLCTRCMQHQMLEQPHTRRLHVTRGFGHSPGPEQQTTAL